MSERLELRLPEATLRDIDNWRARQSDLPTRSEAIRRLVEQGLAGPDQQIRFSPGEVLILHMLCNITTRLKLKSEIDPKLLASILSGGHYWALNWEFGSLVHSHADDPAEVKETVDILDMWDFLEAGYGHLNAKERSWLETEAEPFGKDVKFPGFDGNNERHYIIASFIVDDLGRFARFKGRHLNSHGQVLEGYQRMLAVFTPLRAKLAGRSLTAEEIGSILKARFHPSRRN